MRPLGLRVMVRVIRETNIGGVIALQSTTGITLKGTVIALPHGIGKPHRGDWSDGEDDFPIVLGDFVYFTRDGKGVYDVGNDNYIVDFESLLAKD